MSLRLGTPHALDYAAYADGVDRPAELLALEARDPFWRTLGGRTPDSDPWADGGETFRQRRQARDLGLCANLECAS